MPGPLDLTDPQLYEHALAVHQAQGRAIEELLIAAVSSGELRAGTDTAALAGAVQAIIAGAGLTWALDRQGMLPQRLRREINTLVSPHIPPSESSDLEES
ncbi:TetR family transcriptional regulator C-terminal domain-containing protein [Streptomyces sp. NPDC001933]|uniref:TetR family transcriptional regulator C-terminal domain-containing protein n=1 Tax=Streptomyces sp. NPDC001933 TaxID=3364626 RepID=UPI0036B196A8